MAFYCKQDWTLKRTLLINYSCFDKVEAEKISRLPTHLPNLNQAFKRPWHMTYVWHPMTIYIYDSVTLWHDQENKIKNKERRNVYYKALFNFIILFLHLSTLLHLYSVLLFY